MRNKKDSVVVFSSDYITALGLVRSLGEGGYRPECYYYGTSDYILKSRYCSGGKRFATREDVLQYLLNDYPVYDEKPILFTIPDPPALLVDNNKDELSKKFILQSAGEQGRLAFLMDKSNISKMAQDCGLNVPWMVQMSKGMPIPEDLKYPVFTKSNKSADGGKVDEGICRNRTELEEKIKQMKSDDFLVMQYVNKVKEINYFGLAIKGRIFIDYCDVCTEFSENAYGSYNHFYLAPKDELYYQIVDLLQKTGYEGLFDVEFLLGDDGKMYFVEVNFRADGAFFKMCEGINLPAEWRRLANLPKEQLPQSLETKKKDFWAISEYEHYEGCVKTGKISKLKWLAHIITANRRTLLYLRDPYPSCIVIANLILNKIRYLLNRRRCLILKKVDS